MTEDTTTYDNTVDSDLGRDASAGFRKTPSGRTPMYAAYNSPRYQRQDLIGKIQEGSGYRLICYVSGSGCRIVHDDAMQFRDLLHPIEDGDDIELMLHTPGGDIDAAEKLILMIRDKVGEGRFRVIVPHLAKSAGTLMVLGADSVVMSDTSELGPIDPQVLLTVSSGERMWLPAQSYLDAFDEHSAQLQQNPRDMAATLMLNKLDPAIRQLCIAVKERSRRLAEQLLLKGMFREGAGPWTAIPHTLLDTKQWRTHSQVISWYEAGRAPLGLRVDYLPPRDELWQQYWQLYCLQRLALKENEKLFESDYVSLSLTC